MFGNIHAKIVYVYIVYGFGTSDLEWRTTARDCSADRFILDIMWIVQTALFNISGIIY